MLKPTKKNITNFFTYYLWIVIVFAIVTFASTTLLLSAINKIQDHERFSIFFAAYGITEERGKEDIQELLKDDGIVEVNYYSYRNDDSRIGAYYQAFGYYSEINILSEKDVKDMKETIKNVYIPLTNEFKNAAEIPSIYQTYDYEDKPYALKIFDKDDESYNAKFNYSTWINFETPNIENENFYLLLSYRSPNFGEYGKRNINTSAIKGLKYFLHENTK